jgi:hypothetical protein
VKKKMKMKPKPIISMTRDQIPPVDKHVRYRRGPLLPGWTSYRITLPPEK